jgi:CRISPR type IV-associated protein Csf2
MSILNFEGIMTAQTSISHIGDTFGINARLRREKVIQPDGQVEEVPIISGNAIRGILRDRGMFHMLKALGYGLNEKTGEVSGLSLAAFYFLFSGGVLTSKGGNAGLDVDEGRRWRNLIPLVAIFGGAMGNQIMPGKLRCGKAIPICKETAHLIPDRYVSGAEQSIWEMVQEEAYTRRDDEKNENLRILIAPAVRGLLEADAAAKRAKRGTDDEKAGETGLHQQMRYYIETLAAGTRLFWDMVLDDATPLEYDALCVTLLEFARYPYIGGKSGVGHGKVAINFDKWVQIDPRIAPVGSEVDVTIGTRYLNHLKENGAAMREVIDGLV